MPDPKVAIAKKPIVMENIRVNHEFKEIKQCPQCGSEKYVEKIDDTECKTKVGYLYFCKRCKKEFPACWE